MATIIQPLLGPFPGIAALLPVAGSVLLLSQPPQGWVSKLLSCKTLVWIGLLSYSLYLWHWPVLAFLRYYTGAEVLSVDFSLMFILMTLMLSIASYYGVERAFRTNRTNKKQAIGWVLLASGVLGTSQVMAKVNAVFTPEQLPIEYRRYADPATICHGKTVGDCLKGDLASDKEVLVLGDSHAAMLNHFFDKIGKELGFKARVITASSCVTIPDFDYKRISEWSHQSCLEQIEAARLHADTATSIFIAGSWSYHVESQEFLEVLESFMIEARGSVFLLSQVPRFVRDISRVKRFHDIGLSLNIKQDESYKIANKVVSDMVRDYSNVGFLDLSGVEFFSQAPFYKSSIMYFDSHHINEVGSFEYADSALPFFDKMKSEGSLF